MVRFHKQAKKHRCCTYDLNWRKFVKPLAFFSSMVFPVYFIHLLVIEILKGGVLGFSITPFLIHPAVGILMMSLITFFVSMLISVVIRFIPYSSRVVG